MLVFVGAPGDVGILLSPLAAGCGELGVFLFVVLLGVLLFSEVSIYGLLSSPAKKTQTNKNINFFQKHK